MNRKKIRKGSCRFSRRTLFHFAALLFSMVLGACLFGQEPTEDIRDSLERLRKGEVYPADINKIVEARAIQAVPILRTQFSIQRSALLKAAIASGLVRLGEQDETYWHLLEERARMAIASDAPSVFLLDSQGAIVRGRGEFSRDFLEWAKKNDVDPNAAAEAQILELPGFVTFLGLTGERRGQTLLRRGMSSPNFLIQAAAAKGLAKLRDHESIPLIIEACKKAPKEMTPLIARALVYFDDPRAQAAAEAFIQNKRSLEDLRRRSREKGADPFSY